MKDRRREILERLWYMGNRHDREIDVDHAISELSKLDAMPKEVEEGKIINDITDIMIQVIYNEMYPLPENPTAEETNNRKAEAIEKYLGINLKSYGYPVLHYKVDKIMALIAKAIVKNIQAVKPKEEVGCEEVEKEIDKEWLVKKVARVIKEFEDNPCLGCEDVNISWYDEGCTCNDFEHWEASLIHKIKETSL